MKPYVMAAKFVLGRQATTRDVHAMGRRSRSRSPTTRARAARRDPPTRNDRPLARARRRVETRGLSERDRREEVIHDRMSLFGIDLVGEVHRAFHVGEEHRHLFPLAFEGAARGEDLLGEVLRGIGARIGCRWARFVECEWPPAFAAEPKPRRVLGAAARASRG
jgi:hypothetical protein